MQVWNKTAPKHVYLRDQSDGSNKDPRTLGLDGVFAHRERALPLQLPERLSVHLFFCEGPADRARLLRAEIERLVLLSSVKLSEGVAFVAGQRGEHASD
jgi:hypothetical protein